MFERILVPIDFSEAGRVAVRNAGALARRFLSEVTLLHVNEPLAFYPPSGPMGFGIEPLEAMRAEYAASRQKQLEELAASELSGVKVRRMVCSGDPARLIVERARAERSDLIIMPTHGRGVFRRFLLGSVTAKVLHDSECPVWTGAHLAETPDLDPVQIEHVMCAVSFEPRSAKLIAWAARFAQEIGARLTVTHAVLEAPPGLPERYCFQWQEEAHWGADEQLHILLRDTGIEADILVVSDGNVPGALASAARAKHMGLLVIGRCSSAEEHKRFGDHVYSIICHAPCAVVSL